MGAPSDQVPRWLALAWRIKRVMGYSPGWPELAFPTTSAARVRMVAMQASSVGSGVNLGDMADGRFDLGCASYQSLNIGQGLFVRTVTLPSCTHSCLKND